MQPPSSTHSSERLASERLAKGDFVAPLLGGLIVRAAFFWAFDGTTLLGDEKAYVMHGQRLAETGAYSGVWAPGYPAIVGVISEAFGERALSALRAFQALLSLSTCVLVGHLADRVSGRKSAICAMWLFALYLPLAAFSGLLFSETVFTAVFTAVLLTLVPPRHIKSLSVARAAWAGLLLAMCCLLRESGLFFVAPLALWVCVSKRRAAETSWPRAAALSAAFLAAFAVGLMPWTVRNMRVHDGLVPVSLSAGGNAFQGWNAHDVNFDHAGLNEDARGSLRKSIRGPAPEAWTKRPLSDGREGMRENVSTGLAFGLAHPGFFIRSRAVELIDLVAPTSFLVRRVRLVPDLNPPLSSVRGRRTVGWLGATMAILLGVLSTLGFGCSRLRCGSSFHSLAAMVVLSTVSTAALIGLSRFRVPMIPVLIVLAAAWISAPRGPGTRRRHAVTWVSLGVLILLWIPSIPSLMAALEAIR